VADIDWTLWAPILGTWVLVIGTLAFAYWQLRQNQRLHSTSTLLELRERFYNPRLRQARKSLSTWLLDPNRGEEPGNFEVGIFFELLGSLTRAHILDRRLVRKAFGTWVTSYYTFLNQPRPLFERWRKETNDPLIFADFEWLAKLIINYERQLDPKPDFEKLMLEEARSVIEGEAQLEVAG